MKNIKLEYFDNDKGDEDHINLQSERREISPSFESNRGDGDSPRLSTSKKKRVFAIGAMLMFVGSLSSAVFLMTDDRKTNEVKTDSMELNFQSKSLIGLDAEIETSFIWNEE